MLRWQIIDGIALVLQVWRNYVDTDVGIEGFELGNIFQLYQKRDSIKIKAASMFDIAGNILCVMGLRWLETRQNRILEATLIVVFNVNNGTFFGYGGRSLNVGWPRKWAKFRYNECEFIYEIQDEATTMAVKIFNLRFQLFPWEIAVELVGTCYHLAIRGKVPIDVLQAIHCAVREMSWCSRKNSNRATHTHTIKQPLSFVEQMVANSKVVRNRNTTWPDNYNVFSPVSTCMLGSDFKNLLAVALDEAFVRYVASVGRYDDLRN